MHDASSWGKQTLSRLGSIYTLRQAHDDLNTVIVSASLLEALIQGIKVNASKLLNFLELPGYGDLRLPVSLSSNLHAYEQTISHLDLLEPIPEGNAWHLVATKDVYLPTHMDAKGAAVMIFAEVKAKLLFMLMSTASSFGKATDLRYSVDLNQEMKTTPAGVLKDMPDWQVQGVLLLVGDMIIMPPGTYHFDYTLELSVCNGRHFYAASTIWESCWAIFHTFNLGRTVANTDHTKNQTGLVNLMAYWHQEFINGLSDSLSAP
ncbi:hypothetical protein V5O48_016310, partial [Marasmius crinis-equi]